jgi:hypothetical protein
MQRPAHPTTTEAARHPRGLRALWRRLLAEDDLDAAHAGGSPQPITGSGTSTDDGGRG